MQTVIGLGAAGCNIAKKFDKYDGYNVLLIDSDPVLLDEDDKKRCFLLPVQDNPEMYEKNAQIDDLRAFLSQVDKEVIFVVSGAGKVSGASLVALEVLRDRKVHVVYVCVDRSMLWEVQKLQDRVVFNVLQEMARSGVFADICLVDNRAIESVIGDASIEDYYDKINEAVASTLYMIDELKQSESISGKLHAPAVGSKIVTIGGVNFDTEEESLFFPLSEVESKHYLFALPQEKIKSDKSLMKKIRTFVKKQGIPDKTEVSHSVYSTSFDDDFVYCVAFSSVIQDSLQ